MTEVENKLMTLDKQELVKLIIVSKGLLDKKNREIRFLNEELDCISHDFERISKKLDGEEDIDFLLC